MKTKLSIFLSALFFSLSTWATSVDVEPNWEADLPLVAVTYLEDYTVYFGGISFQLSKYIGRVPLQSMKYRYKVKDTDELIVDWVEADIRSGAIYQALALNIYFTHEDIVSNLVKYKNSLVLEMSINNEADEVTHQMDLGKYYTEYPQVFTSVD